jgi:hypothetical protein
VINNTEISSWKLEVCTTTAPKLEVRSRKKTIHLDSGIKQLDGIILVYECSKEFRRY